MEWRLIYESGSGAFELIPTIEQISPALVDLSIRVAPQPRKDEFVEFTFYGKSRYLFPIYFDETCTEVDIKGKVYTGWAGVIRSARTEVVRLQFRFPKQYGLNVSDISCLVATYSSTVQFVIDSEIERIITSIESFGGNIVANLTISKPLLGCLYAIDWPDWRLPRTRRLTFCPKRSNESLNRRTVELPQAIEMRFSIANLRGLSHEDKGTR